MTVQEAFEIVKKECNQLHKYMELDEQSADYYIADAFGFDSDYDVEYFNGASKAVLVFPDCDYVIKIPFNGYQSEINDYDDDNEDDYWDREPEFEHYDFECAPDDDMRLGLLFS